MEALLVGKGLDVIVALLKLANKPLDEKLQVSLNELQTRLAELEAVPYNEQDDGEISMVYRKLHNTYTALLLAMASK